MKTWIKVALILLIVLAIVIVVAILLPKIVIVPSITVTVDKTEYYRGDTVTISGTVKVGTVGQSGKTVALAVTPPTGDTYSLPSVTTNSTGGFKTTWIVPSDAAGGVFTVTGTSLGISGTKTFTGS